MVGKGWVLVAVTYTKGWVVTMSMAADGSDDDQFKFTPDSNNEVDDHRFSLDQEFVPETEF
uniref:Uncharacterized protein n=1 Tax=Oryza rufipogon TaxID=4529 RepID=A0A0E0PJ69_ORYRU